MYHLLFDESEIGVLHESAIYISFDHKRSLKGLLVAGGVQELSSERSEKQQPKVLHRQKSHAKLNESNLLKQTKIEMRRKPSKWSKCPWESEPAFNDRIYNLSLWKKIAGRILFLQEEYTRFPSMGPTMVVIEVVEANYWIQNDKTKG